MIALNPVPRLLNTSGAPWSRESLVYDTILCDTRRWTHTPDTCEVETEQKKKTKNGFERQPDRLYQVHQGTSRVYHVYIMCILSLIHRLTARRPALEPHFQTSLGLTQKRSHSPCLFPSSFPRFLALSLPPPSRSPDLVPYRARLCW